MRIRSAIAGTLLLLASLTACGSESDSKTTEAASPSASISQPEPAATETGISKDCADDVFDMLIDEMNGEETPDSRPASCANLNDEQWSQAIDEASDKALAAGGAALGDDSSSDADEQPTKVTFKVWGTAPSGVDITYGSDSENLDGGGLPMKTTLEFEPNALYYSINAQLEGGGDIRCSVTIGDQVEDGHARGDYNICSAQINNL